MVGADDLSLHGSRIPSIFIWSTSGYLLEQSGQMLWILESCLVSYLTDCPVGFKKEVFHFVNNCMMDAFNSGFPGLFLYHVAEIVGGEMELVGAPGYRRES